MKLPASPTGTSTVAGLLEWLRTLAASVAAGFHVEHTETGAHDWHWTDIAYDANRFTGSGSMTWTVDSADVVYYRSGVLGDVLVLEFQVSNTDVGGTPSTALQIALPTGYAARGNWVGALRYSDAGGALTVGACVIADGARIVSCVTSATANWTATTGDNTTVMGTILMRVAKD